MKFFLSIALILAVAHAAELTEPEHTVLPTTTETEHTALPTTTETDHTALPTTTETEHTALPTTAETEHTTEPTPEPKPTKPAHTKPEPEPEHTKPAHTKPEPEPEHTKPAHTKPEPTREPTKPVHTKPEPTREPTKEFTTPHPPATKPPTKPQHCPAGEAPFKSKCLPCKTAAMECSWCKPCASCLRPAPRSLLEAIEMPAPTPKPEDATTAPTMPDRPCDFCAACKACIPVAEAFESGHCKMPEETEEKCQKGYAYSERRGRCVPATCEAADACKPGYECIEPQTPKMCDTINDVCPNFFCARPEEHLPKKCGKGEGFDLESMHCVKVTCEAEHACPEHATCVPKKVPCLVSSCAQFKCERTTKTPEHKFWEDMQACLLTEQFAAVSMTFVPEFTPAQWGACMDKLMNARAADASADDALDTVIDFNDAKEDHAGAEARKKFAECVAEAEEMADKKWNGDGWTAASSTDAKKNHAARPDGLSIKEWCKNQAHEVYDHMGGEQWWDNEHDVCFSDTGDALHECIEAGLNALLGGEKADKVLENADEDRPAAMEQAMRRVKKQCEMDSVKNYTETTGGNMADWVKGKADRERRAAVKEMRECMKQFDADVLVKKNDDEEYLRVKKLCRSRSQEVFVKEGGELGEAFEDSLAAGAGEHATHTLVGCLKLKGAKRKDCKAKAEDEFFFASGEDEAAAADVDIELGVNRATERAMRKCMREGEAEVLMKKKDAAAYRVLKKRCMEKAAKELLEPLGETARADRVVQDGARRGCVEEFEACLANETATAADCRDQAKQRFAESGGDAEEFAHELLRGAEDRAAAVHKACMQRHMNNRKGDENREDDKADRAAAKAICLGKAKDVLVRLAGQDKANEGSLAVSRAVMARAAVWFRGCMNGAVVLTDQQTEAAYSAQKESCVAKAKQFFTDAQFGFSEDWSVADLMSRVDLLDKETKYEESETEVDVRLEIESSKTLEEIVKNMDKVVAKIKELLKGKVGALRVLKRFARRFALVFKVGDLKDLRSAIRKILEDATQTAIAGAVDATVVRRRSLSATDATTVVDASAAAAVQVVASDGATTTNTNTNTNNNNNNNNNNNEAGTSPFVFIGAGAGVVALVAVVAAVVVKRRSSKQMAHKATEFTMDPEDIKIGDRL